MLASKMCAKNWSKRETHRRGREALVYLIGRLSVFAVPFAKQTHLHVFIVVLLRWDANEIPYTLARR